MPNYNQPETIFLVPLRREKKGRGNQPEEITCKEYQLKAKQKRIAWDGANAKDKQEESDDFPGNAILPIRVDVVRYLYHLPVSNVCSKRR